MLTHSLTPSPQERLESLKKKKRGRKFTGVFGSLLYFQESSQGQERGGSKASCGKTKATPARRGEIRRTCLLTRPIGGCFNDKMANLWLKRRTNLWSKRRTNLTIKYPPVSVGPMMSFGGIESPGKAKSWNQKKLLFNKTAAQFPFFKADMWHSNLLTKVENATFSGSLSFWDCGSVLMVGWRYTLASFFFSLYLHRLRLTSQPIFLFP